MSIQIYQDAENILPGLQNGKKNKREDSRLTRQHVPKPSKRTALGTINTNVQGCRVQPSRAVKEKYKVYIMITIKVCFRDLVLGLQYRNKTKLRFVRGQDK